MASVKHSGMSAQFNRRSLLAAAPALGLLAAVPAIATAAPSLIAEMHRKITRAQELLNSPGNGLTDAQADMICDRMMEMANAIIDVPAENATDMLRKILGYTVNGDHDLGQGAEAAKIIAEARALIG